MGYDLHVTRSEFWYNFNGTPISLDEWLAYIANDPDITGDPENPQPKNAILVNHPSKWPLWWRKGEVRTKNPDDLVVAKLLQIANALGATVQGDDAEVYELDPANPGKSKYTQR